MKFSTIITIIASVAVGSANASTSFLRSSVNEDPAAAPESQADCYTSCLTPEGRAKKVKDLSKKKVTNSVEECFEVHCDGANRSIEQIECTSKCAKDFGKGVEKSIEKAIDDCEDKCEKSCSSSDEDESGSKDDCKRDCDKECASGSLDKSVQKKAQKNLGKTFANGNECIESCFAPATDYETLKIA